MRANGKQTKSVARADGGGLMVAAFMANSSPTAPWKVGGIANSLVWLARHVRTNNQPSTFAGSLVESDGVVYKVTYDGKVNTLNWKGEQRHCYLSPECLASFPYRMGQAAPASSRVCPCRLTLQIQA